MHFLEPKRPIPVLQECQKNPLGKLDLKSVNTRFLSGKRNLPSSQSLPVRKCNFYNLKVC